MLTLVAYFRTNLSIFIEMMAPEAAGNDKTEVSLPQKAAGKAMTLHIK